jgi:hypothetical protein
MKKFIRKTVVTIAVGLVVGLGYPLRNGQSLRGATEDEITQQVPYALDILAVRHPLKVGLLRTLLNDQGAVDRLAQDYVRSSMDRNRNVSAIDCYLAYYAVVFDKDDVRQGLADGLEKQFDL